MLMLAAERCTHIAHTEAALLPAPDPEILWSRRSRWSDPASRKRRQISFGAQRPGMIYSPRAVVRRSSARADPEQVVVPRARIAAAVPVAGGEVKMSVRPHRHCAYAAQAVAKQHLLADRSPPGLQLRRREIPDFGSLLFVGPYHRPNNRQLPNGGAACRASSGLFTQHFTHRTAHPARAPRAA